jgi:NADPH:quinone reductase-like Zn-dependent oxidoreductase
MKAIVQDEYGSPDVLELREIDKPVVKDDEMLVRVRAASVNPADWHYMRGVPYIMRPQVRTGRTEERCSRTRHLRAGRGARKAGRSTISSSS